MQIKNLFKTKQQIIKQSCHDMQLNVNELIRLNNENIRILDEAKIKLEKLGDNNGIK